MKQDLLIEAFNKVRTFLKGRSNIRDIPITREDALQEAFYRLWKRKYECPSLQETVGSLQKITNNLIIDEIRKSPENTMPINENIVDEKQEENQNYETGNLYKEVYEIASRALSPRDLEILIQREQNGWKFEELAEHYNLSEVNIRQIVSRGRKTIREMFNMRKNGKSLFT